MMRRFTTHLDCRINNNTLVHHGTFAILFKQGPSKYDPREPGPWSPGGMLILLCPATNLIFEFDTSRQEAICLRSN
jgi:hypothetical protein